MVILLIFFLLITKNFLWSRFFPPLSYQPRNNYTSLPLKNVLIIHMAKKSFLYIFQVTRSITDDKKPNPGWDKKPNIIGQHYVRSITYGGNLIASLKFSAKTEKDKKNLAIKVETKVKGKKFGVGVGGQFKQLAESVKDISTLSISFKATAPLVTVPTDIDSLVKAIKDFPQSVSL